MFLLFLSSLISWSSALHPKHSFPIWFSLFCFFALFLLDVLSCFFCLSFFAVYYFELLNSSVAVYAAYSVPKKTTVISSSFPFLSFLMFTSFKSCFSCNFFKSYRSLILLIACQWCISCSFSCCSHCCFLSLLCPDCLLV